MKTYILTIIGAAVLSSFASMLAPDKWRKYVGVITGLVIISCIIAPIAGMTRTELFSGFDAIENAEEYSINLQEEMIQEELSKRVSEDIAARLEREFNIKVTAKVQININDNHEITGIEKIRIKGESLTPAATARLCEVYGVSSDKIKNE